MTCRQALSVHDVMLIVVRVGDRCGCICIIYPKFMYRPVSSGVSSCLNNSDISSLLFIKLYNEAIRAAITCVYRASPCCTVIRDIYFVRNRKIIRTFGTVQHQFIKLLFFSHIYHKPLSRSLKSFCIPSGFIIIIYCILSRIRIIRCRSNPSCHIQRNFLGYFFRLINIKFVD